MKIDIGASKIDVEIPIGDVLVRRNILRVKGQREDGLYDYEITPMPEDMEAVIRQILRDPQREFLKVRCGDSRMEEIGILLACLLYNARGPAHTFAGGCGVPSRMIAKMSNISGEHAVTHLEDLEIVAKSSWINYKKLGKIFRCNGTIYYEHSECHGWNGVTFSGPEQEQDLHLQSSIILTKQKIEVFEQIDQSFVVYARFEGRKLISIDIYYLVFS